MVTQRPESNTFGQAITRRDSLKLLGGAGAGLVAAVCAPGSSTADVIADSAQARVAVPAFMRSTTTIRYWTWASSAEDNPRSQAQGQILDAFRKANPDIEVVEEVVAWQQLRQQLLQAAAAGRAPDVSRQVDQYLLSHAEAEVILPLDPFVSGWSADRQNDYLYSWDDTTVEGKKYAFRQAVRPSNVLYYRPDLYQDAGIAAPPATWDELTAATRATTNGPVSGFIMPFSKSDNISHVMQHVPPMLWSLGSDLVDSATGEAAFHREAGVKVFRWIQDLVHTYKVMSPGVATLDAEASDQQFLAGVVANIFANTAKWGQWSQQEAIAGRIATAGFPNFGNDPSTPGSANNGGGWTLVMPTGANEEAAWKLIEFFQSPEAELIDAKVGGEIPTRKSTLLDPWFATPEAAKLKDYMAWMAANPHEATTLKIKQIEVLTDALGDAVQQIVANDADVEPTLTFAAEKYNEQVVR